MNTTREAANALLWGAVILLLTVAPVNWGSAQTCVQPAAGLVSWWPGDGNAKDIADGNDGTLQNGATFAVGQVEQAFRFDGVDDHVLIGNPPTLHVQDFTIEAWIRLQTLALAETGCPQIVAYGQGGYGFAVSSGPTRCQSGPGGLNPIGTHELVLSKVGFNGVSSQGVVIPDTDWHHVAVTKRGGTVTFYLDGVGTPVSISYDPGFSFTTNVAIGMRQDILEDAFPGWIDEVEIYNRALSAAEIQAIFDAGSAGKCQGATLLDHFKCYAARGHALNVPVDLQDQFDGELGVLVRKPQLFCNPVDTNREGIRHPTAHLTCYEITAGREERDVVVENQFGQQTLHVAKPELLCVPTEKMDVIPAGR